MPLICGRLYDENSHPQLSALKQMGTPIFANSLNFFVRKNTGNAQIIRLGDLLIQVPTSNKPSQPPCQKKDFFCGTIH